MPSTKLASRSGRSIEPTEVDSVEHSRLATEPELLCFRRWSARTPALDFWRWPACDSSPLSTPSKCGRKRRPRGSLHPTGPEHRVRALGSSVWFRVHAELSRVTLFERADH